MVRLGQTLLIFAAAGITFLGIAAAQRIGWPDGFVIALIPVAVAVLFVVIALKPRGREPKARVRRYGSN
jgi:hypothetical protein